MTCLDCQEFWKTIVSADDVARYGNPECVSADGKDHGPCEWCECPAMDRDGLCEACWLSTK